MISSLPYDILLVVFRHLDDFDIVFVGMVCKDLHRITQDRHVWVERLEKLLQKSPALGPAIPPLPSLSNQELKSLVIHRIRFLRRWDKCRTGAQDFAKKGMTEVTGRCEPILLPGGRSLLVVSHHGDVTLRRIELKDGQVSLPIVAGVESDKGEAIGVIWTKKLLTTMSPCPILVQGYRDESTVRILRVDHHNNAMGLEATFYLPDGYHLLRADGRGRIIGLLAEAIDESLEAYRMMVIHLDYPGVIVEPGIPLTFLNKRLKSFNNCVPTSDVVVVCSNEGMLVCKIPDFSTLSLGINPTNATPIPAYPCAPRGKVICETIHNPLSAQRFNVYILSARGTVNGVTTITVPIALLYCNTGPISKSYRPTILKRESGLVHRLCTLATPRENGLCITRDTRFRFHGFIYLVAPLKGVTLHDSRRFYQVSVSNEEVEMGRQRIEVDEATGRVVVWEGHGESRRTRILVGDLV